MTARPLGDRILVRRVEAETISKGGLVIPDVGKEKPLEGTVVAVGEGRLTDSKMLIPMRVRVGERVLFGKYAGVEIKLDGIDHAILREDEILCVIQ